jgi:hypothetical protein
MGPVVQSYRCWRLDTATGPAPQGCNATSPTGPWVEADVVQPAGRDLFVVGHTRAPVVRVRLRFADGTSISMRPSHGFYLFAIPRPQLSTKRQLAFVLGLRDDGSVHQRQGVLFKLPR